MILAIDIGGTKVKIALVEPGVLSVTNERRFASSEFSGIESLIQKYCREDKAAFRKIAIGVAGPVVGHRVEVTNLPWILDREALSATFGCPVYLMNDMAAQGMGLTSLGENGRIAIKRGTEATGNLAIIAPGTGLGQGLVVRDGAHYIASPSEGGHSDFAPASERDIRLWRMLTRELGHVSWERVVSGFDGFRNLYRFLCEQDDCQHIEGLATPLAEGKDISYEVLDAARSSHPTGLTIVEWLIESLAREAGNLALKGMATGGIYIAGGLAKPLLPWLRQRFLDGFVAKGRFRAFLEKIPVWVVSDPHLALRGAALLAEDTRR